MFDFVPKSNPKRERGIWQAITKILCANENIIKEMFLESEW